MDRRGRFLLLAGLILVVALLDLATPPSLVLLSPETVTSLLGDYNGNGVVDAADYTIWKDSFGSTADLAADGNGNGVIDAADYTIWKDNFGSSLSGSAVASVPEPATCTLGLLLLVGLVIQRSRPLSHGCPQP